jgi:hypothetical protein
MTKLKEIDERDMDVLDDSWTPEERKIFRQFLIEEKSRQAKNIIPDYKKLDEIDVLDSGDVTPEDHAFTSKFLKAYKALQARQAKS